MRDCKIAWKVRLLEEWLPNWKANVPQRWLEEWKNGVPESWVEKFQQTVPEGWSGKLVKTRDAIFDLLLQIEQSYVEKHRNKKSEGKSEPVKKKKKGKSEPLKKKSEGKSEQNEKSNLLDETYNKIFSDFKTRKNGVMQNLTGRKTWESGAAPNKKRENKVQVALCWEAFLAKLIDILLEKEPQIRTWLENHDPQFDPEEVYSWITWQMNILDSFIPSVYKAELHGRNQPFPEWRDLIDEAIELHLNGKRQWNTEEHPDIKPQIEATASSLVSHANEKEKKLRENDADCKHKLGGSISLFSQKMGEVEDESVYETAFATFFDNEVDDELNIISSPGSDDSNDFLQYEGMTHGDEQRVSDDGEDSELRQQIYEVVHNDPELIRLVEYLLKHEPPYNPTSNKFLFKTQEVAKALQLDEQKINNLRRRLKRRLTAIFFIKKVRPVILNNVDDNPRLISMVNFLFDNELCDPKSKAFIFKPQKIANGLRWTVPEVNTLKKELQRKLKRTEIKGYFFVEKVRSIVWQRVRDSRQLILIVVSLFHNDLYVPESKTFIFDPETIAKELQRTVSEVNNLKEELQNRLETLHINVVEPELV
jgi:hypothetical protein